MSALFAGELRRVMARRLVRAVFALVALGIVVGGAVVFVKTQYLSESAYQARVKAAQANLATLGNAPPGVPICTTGSSGAGGSSRVGVAGGAGSAGGTGSAGQPVVLTPGSGGAPCISVEVHDPRFHLTSLKGVYEGVTAPLVLLAILIGASVIGAEWPSRTITTILTWEPRRLRVFAAKQLCALVVCLALAVAGLLVLGLALLPSALLHGTTSGTTSAWWQTLSGIAGRSVATVAIGTVVGFAIASIGRNTAAALGILFAYVVVIERVVATFVHGLGQWLIAGNAIVFVSGNPADLSGDHSRSVLAAGLYLAAIAVGMYIIAAVVFERRDVA